MSKCMEPTVSSDIEDAYAEIGRSVVGIAIAQAREAGMQRSAWIETAVTMRLVFQPGAATGSTVMCCICTRDIDDVWTCAGPCCPAGPDQ